ncbi:HNH endonuclease signature motif containing protein [Dermatophilaceae bacterium Soc4.6]
MFDWGAAAAGVTEGSVSPLALVADLEGLDDVSLLGLDLGDAVGVLEVVTAASAALSAVSALVIEAVARRTREELARRREEQRQRGERVAAVGAAQALAQAAHVAEATLAPVLHLTPRTTGAHLEAVRVLVNDLPATFALVRAGRLDLHRASAVATEGALVAPELRDAFDQEVLTLGGRVRTPLTDLTPGSVHRRGAAAAVRVDPDAAAARAADALDKRHVRVRPGTDPGVTSWSAVLPSDTSLKAWAAVDALASQYAAATPGMLIGQARADAMADLILAQATIRTHIELLVPYTPFTTDTTDTTDTTEAAEHEPTPQVTIRPGTRPAPTCPAGNDPDATCTTCAPPPPTATVYERHLHLVVAHGTQIDITTLTPLDTHLRHPDSGANTDTDREPEQPQPLGDVFLDPLEALFLDPLEALFTDPDGDTPGCPSLTPPPLRPPSPDPATCLIGVRHPRVGIILNTAVTTWLAHPDTRLRLATYDPATGALTGHDPTTYRPNAALARAVRTRDGHCRFPGCTTDAARTDLDHVIAFPVGPTAVTNLACLCRKHHTFKHHAGWTLTMTPDATCTWTTPPRPHLHHPPPHHPRHRRLTPPPTPTTDNPTRWPDTRPDRCCTTP